MTKLKDDPAVVALLEKQAAEIAKTHLADHKRTVKAIVKHLTTTAAERAADAKQAGNKDAALYLKSLAADVAGHVKETHLNEAA